MPGPEVKNWKQYEKLREKGFSKEEAARITNASWAKKHGKQKKKLRGKK
jgi:hypothetical protein